VLARVWLVIAFVGIFGGILLLDLIFDGHIRVGPAVCGAVGGVIGMAITRGFRRGSIRS
jgi:hypothetical protein